MSFEDLVKLFIGAVSGGGITSVVQLVISHRAGVRTADVERDQVTVQEEKTALDGFRDLVKELRGAHEAMAERVASVERQIEAERSLKWASIQHIRSLYAWIAHHLPGVPPPAPPEALAEHIVYPYPRKEDS